MSNKSLGNLTVNLVLNTGSFTEGYTSADRVFNQMNAQVERQQKALEKLTKQFDPTTAKLRELADSQRVLNDLMAGGAVSNQTYDRLSSQLQKMSDEVYSANSALAEQARQVSQLVNQLDPAIAKYAELDIMQNRLQEGLKAGLVSTDDFERYSAKLASTREEYDKLYTSAGKLATEQEKQQQELSNILRLLDPVNTKLAELDVQQQKLVSGLSAGTINQTQYDQATAKLNEMRNAIDGTTEAQRLAEVETSKQVTELQRLSARLDPLTYEFKELDKAQRLLQSGLDKGLINSTEFERMSAEVNRSKKALNDLTNTNKATELSAKQLKQSLAGLPAQFTDIVVSLQGGQNPFTVFLQQGGQIKDQFGGGLPAVKAMAGYIAGLINPFTVAAGAAGVLGYAYYKASIEQDKFRDSIIFTGNAAGVTVDGLNEMSKQLSATIGTQGKAAEAIAAAATTGKFTAAQLALVSESAVRMEKVTGKAIDDTVKEFEKLAKEPAKEIAKLNEEQNFLTVAIYEQIKALEDQGRTQEAATLAMKTYSDVTEDRTSKVLESLGYIESAWNSIKSASSGALNSIMDIGRPEQISEQLEKLRAELERAKNPTTSSTPIITGAGLAPAAPLGVVDQQRIKYLEKEINLLETKQSKMELDANGERLRAELTKIGIEASQRLSKEMDSLASKTEKKIKN
ncbi:phage tail length tape measure family protein [Rheinheimera sp. MM224]|uniref:phage tail length tape measure family protein n=1 Tax=Rheinheimera sp. MM224 TaxID=3019969 RepID=UPI0021F8BEF1|nr:phage tail length tape measure family protein [Rheinheimera sp. MM224]CAI3796044.1 hypothetical protein JAMGFMIE_01469 [Rheinheimera sp. MM224]